MVGNDGRLADDDRWWGMMAGWRMVAGWRMMTDGRGEKFFAPTIGRGMGDGGAIYRRSGDGCRDVGLHIMRQLADNCHHVGK